MNRTNLAVLASALLLVSPALAQQLPKSPSEVANPGGKIAGAQVAVVPGLDFGSDAHVRLSYATSDALITEGLQRMAAAIKTLG